MKPNICKYITLIFHKRNPFFYICSINNFISSYSLKTSSVIKNSGLYKISSGKTLTGSTIMLPSPLAPGTFELNW